MINLMTKWAGKLAEAFDHESFTAGKASSDYDFVGVKSIRVLSAQTQELNDYSRTGTSRYGTPADMQDTAQEMTLTQDKSFSIVIDKGDNSEQMMLKNAGRKMNKQQRERVVPTVDKYNISKWCRMAGKVAANAAPTKDTIVGLLLAAETWFEDHFVPINDRYAYMSNATYELFRTSSDFAGCDRLTEKLIINGWKGNIGTLKIITVPSTHIPTGVNFLAAYKGSVLAPHKIHEANIHENPPGISGHLLEGRDIFDAFVLGENCDGVYLNVLTANKATKPTATKGATTTSLAAGAGETIRYTLDGTDPRYSITAVTYGAAFTNPDAGTLIRAVASDNANNIYDSDLLEHTCV